MRPLGYAIIGGLMFSTVLTLYLVPVAYVLLETARARLLHPKRKTAALEPAEAR